MNSPEIREAFTPPELIGQHPKRLQPPPWKPYRILRSSWKEDDIAFNDKYGLTGAILKAYNQHHSIVLRPDNFWQAILTQFSFYVNANAEKLRDRLVSHEGKKKLTVRQGGTLETYNYANFINMMQEKIKKKIKDASVADWLLPNFTTTTPTDRVTAGVSVMSILQEFFIFRFGGGCGLPFVTLLGEIEDWEILRAKIDRLLEFEVAGQTFMKQWHEWLANVLDNLVESANGNPNLHFWETCIKHQPNGSAPGYLSGWMSTFNVFTSLGQWQANKFSYQDYHGPVHFVETWFPVINPDHISSGICKAPVKVEDPARVWNDCFLFAGQFRSNPHENTTLQPTTDWYIAIEDKEDVWDRRDWIHPSIRPPLPDPNRPKTPPPPEKPVFVYKPTARLIELALPKPVPKQPKLPFSFRPSTAKPRKHRRTKSRA